MSVVKKIQLVLSSPGVIVRFLLLQDRLKKNREKKIHNLVFQCDVPMHFNYLEPYYRALVKEPGVEIFFSGHFKGRKVKKILLAAGVPAANIIENIEVVGRTLWDLYMSPTSWGNVFPANSDCARIQIFHTLADKNIQYGENLLAFNTIFVCGPIHHEFLEKYLFTPFPEAKKTCLCFDVGYPKNDDLLNGCYSTKSLKENLGISLEDQRKIILYAPNWEEYSALHRYGRKAFEALADLDYIILIKLHYMSLLSPNDIYATGGVDWQAMLDEFRNVENIHIIDDSSIDPYLFLADLLITDYGGVAFEYICVQKPIIYLDCPDFFLSRGTDIMEYWSRDTGTVVSGLQNLEQVIEESFCEGTEKMIQRKKLAERILYNPGRGAETGKEVILNQVLQEYE